MDALDALDQEYDDKESERDRLAYNEKSEADLKAYDDKKKLDEQAAKDEEERKKNAIWKGASAR